MCVCVCVCGLTDGEALLQELSECGGSEADPEDLDDYITMLVSVR